MNANAQSPNWLWATKAGISNDDVSNAVSTDAAGNIYITGQFNGPSITFGNIVLTNSGSCDVYVVKYDPSGNVLWAISASGNSCDIGNNISVDSYGNVIVVGSFSSSSLTFGNQTVTNHNSLLYDIFIVKLDPNGNAIWLKNGGGYADDFGNCVCCDGNGNSYVIGSFLSSSINFGNLTTNNSSNNTYDIFIVKYDAMGTAMWCKGIGGNANDYGCGICINPDGTFCITGNFQSSIIAFNSYILSNNSANYDIFIAKINGMGNTLWAKNAGGVNYDKGTAVAADGFGNNYITGYFQSSPASFGLMNLYNSGGADIFIAKYDTLGNTTWAKSIGGINNELGNCIRVFGNSLFFAGYFGSSNLILGNDTLTNSGGDFIYVSKYDLAGNEIWSKSVPGTMSGLDAAMNITVNVNQDLFLTGYFGSHDISFDNITLYNAGLWCGTSDIFLAKLNNIEAINDYKTELTSISINPNPSSGIFTIKASRMLNSRVKIYNALGEKIYQSEIRSPQTAIDLSNQPSGLYFYQITSADKQIVTGKLIIQ